MPELARVIYDELKATITAGETPEGEKWAPRKKGNAPVLTNAVDALKVAAVGSRVYVRLVGVETRHHRGRAKGGTRRQVIISSKSFPPRMRERMREAIHRIVKRGLTES